MSRVSAECGRNPAQECCLIDRLAASIGGAGALILVDSQFANDIVAKVRQAPRIRSAVVEKLVDTLAMLRVACLERQSWYFVAKKALADKVPGGAATARFEGDDLDAAISGRRPRSACRRFTRGHFAREFREYAHKCLTLWFPLAYTLSSVNQGRIPSPELAYAGTAWPTRIGYSPLS